MVIPTLPVDGLGGGNAFARPAAAELLVLIVPDIEGHTCPADGGTDVEGDVVGLKNLIFPLLLT